MSCAKFFKLLKYLFKICIPSCFTVVRFRVFMWKSNRFVFLVVSVLYCVFNDVLVTCVVFVGGVCRLDS